MADPFRATSANTTQTISAGQVNHLPIVAHFDTTSVNLYGDYLAAQGAEAPFKIAHGYSKDKRPDLKQFVLSLLCVDGNVPIAGKLEDGNASDKTINHRLLSEVSGHMHKHGVGEAAPRRTSRRSPLPSSMCSASRSSRSTRRSPNAGSSQGASSC